MQSASPTTTARLRGVHSKASRLPATARSSALRRAVGMTLESLEARQMLSVAVAINPQQHFQQIDGFGSAVAPWVGTTGTAAWQDMYYQDLGASMLRFDVSVNALRGPDDNLATPVTLTDNIDDNIKLFNFDYWFTKTLGEAAQGSLTRKIDSVKVIGSLWSAPQWMKGPELDPVTGLPNGNMPVTAADGYDSSGGSLIDTPANLKQFGLYVASWVKGFQQHFGVPMYAISIQNELAFHEWYSSTTYTPQLYVKAIKAVKAAFTQFGITTKIEGPEDVGVGAVNDSYLLWRQYSYINAVRADPVAAAALDIYTIHGYANDGIHTGRSPEMWGQYWNGRVAANQWDAGWVGIKNDGKHSWQTEVSGEPHTWDGAMLLANNAQDALVQGNVSAWVYWQTTYHDNNGADDTNEALTVGTDTNDPKYVAAKHFFRYIRPGAYRVATTNSDPYGVYTSAFVQDADKTLTTVLINELSTPQTITLDLAATGVASFGIDRESDASGNRWKDNGTISVVNGIATITLAANSITTLQGKTDGTAIIAPPPPPPPTLTIVANPKSVTVPEGSSTKFDITLSAKPASPVTILTTKSSGSSSISVSGGSSLTFTAANWNVAQKVTVAAATDSDAVNGSATLGLSGTGVPSVSLSVTEQDTVAPTNPTNPTTPTNPGTGATTGTPVYLSDLTPTSATNAWGPYEKNKSNGEQFAGDGHAISLTGKTFAKGLGVHAGSDMRYDLGGKYGTFAATVGVDDEMNGLGSVAFAVYVDNVKLFDSGVLKGKGGSKAVTLDVTGKQQLRLVVTDGGDGNNWDHADWADAKLTPSGGSAGGTGGTGGTGTGGTGTTTPTTGAGTALSSLTPLSVVNGWGNYERNQSNGEQAQNDGQAITLNGKAYASGLGVHASSILTFAVASGAKRFQSDVGLDDEVDGSGKGSVIFQVYNAATGKLLYASPTMTNSSATQSVDVDLAGVSQLKLVVTDAGDGNGFDHADWAGAKLV